MVLFVEQISLPFFVSLSNRIVVNTQGVHDEKIIHVRQIFDRQVKSVVIFVERTNDICSMGLED